MRDTQYYDRESSRYSEKRYPAVPGSYIQSFYLRRLALSIGLIRQAVHGSGLKLVEIGCADGVVTNALYDEFSGTFNNIAGVDISKAMVEAAAARAGGRHITFSQRDEHVFADTYDLIVEIGVVNYADADAEFRFAREKVSANGYYLCSVAGADSLLHWLKPDEGTGFSNFNSYAKYEAQLRTYFTIVSATPVGLFIPHVWKVPKLARIVQPLCEAVFSRIAPNLYHEKLYLLKPLAR